MGFWDWFWGKPKPPGYWEVEYRSEKGRADKLFYELATCQSEKSLAIAEQKQLISEQHQIINQSNRDLEQTKGLLETNESLLADEVKSNNTLQAENLKLVARVKSLESLANLPFGISPETLKSLLLKKYGLHAEQPKLWDEYDTVLFEIFGVEQPVLLEVTAQDFKDRILKAFPAVQFHSPAKDTLYYLPTEAWVFKALVHDFGDLMTYVPERKDCDAFAQALRSHFTTQYGTKAVVELWGYWGSVYHSWDAIICSDGVLEIEPQTDQVYEAGFLPDHKADSIHDW